ncbi:AraC family transcriptional regulator [Caenibius sp. WL]|uniref:AraC family transcriptional regulator n=1 Tax=Caenibius sp. WL TaxID=2872646 RepID=UPI001C98F02E|nr:AraC family transcriptional regulator [Caenibius sp. WL]QZP08965.1 AraC family transcriptional regulator [Caenibius sp. WL]
MERVTVNAANMRFEYGQFSWPEDEDRRLVSSNHMLSMTNLTPRTLAEGWYELDSDISSPRSLGTIVMVPAAVPLHTRSDGGMLNVARLQFDPADSDLDLLTRERDPSLLSDCLDIRCSEVGYGMRRLAQEAVAPGFASDLLLETIGALIKIDLVRHVRRTRADAHSQNGKGLSHAELRKVQDYIDENLTRRIRVAELAGVLGMSERHFMRLFRMGMGETVYRFVEKRRFEKAKAMLEAERPLKQIAYLLGFSSRVSFTVAFKRISGKSPLSYRKKYLESSVRRN